LRRTTVWIDAAGKTTAHLLTTAAGAAAIEAAIAAVSNAVPQLEWEGPLVAPGGAGVNAAFPSVADTATLTFTKASGELLKVLVPAPISSIFLADAETVDPTQIAALIAAVVGSLSDPSGNLATAYVSGLRNSPS
jgi:hypothetical protein